MIADEIGEEIIESARKLVSKNDAKQITVRDILNDLNITNRVFYNRFHNIDEVLDILYKETISKIRECMKSEYDSSQDYIQYIKRVVTQTFVLSYENKKKFGRHIFDIDANSNENFDWWNGEIIKLINYGKENKYIKSEIDEEKLSYAVWCFIRGFNADAIARKQPLDKATEKFNYSFELLLNGVIK